MTVMISYTPMIVSNRRTDPKRRKIKLISSNITSMTLAENIEVIADWSCQRLSKYVCVANVHMLMEAHWNPDFNAILDSADMVTADGMPLVVLMRLLGAQFQDRVAGLELFTGLCKVSSERNTSVFLLGSDDATLQAIEQRLAIDFPNLKVAGAKSLPFRDEFTDDEEQEVIDLVNASGAGLLFLSLGCPKQETWVARHRGLIKATMIGVGAVFPVYAGSHSSAPDWMRQYSLEWLYRLMQEPRRLWWRYLSTIPPFLYLAVLQLLSKKLSNFKFSVLKGVNSSAS